MSRLLRFQNSLRNCPIPYHWEVGIFLLYVCPLLQIPREFCIILPNWRGSRLGRVKSHITWKVTNFRKEFDNYKKSFGIGKLVKFYVVCPILTPLPPEVSSVKERKFGLAAGSFKKLLLYSWELTQQSPGISYNTPWRSVTAKALCQTHLFLAIAGAYIYTLSTGGGGIQSWSYSTVNYWIVWVKRGV